MLAHPDNNISTAVSFHLFSATRTGVQAIYFLFPFTIAALTNPTLGAIPSSEVTKLVCRLPSPTLITVQLEVSNLGDLMRTVVRLHLP